MKAIRISHTDAREQGFTLVEVMVTVVVLAILLTVAIPGFDNFIRNSRLQGATQDVRAALALARSEAVRLRRSVSVCGDGGGACSGGTGWNAGLLVVVDASNEVVRRWDGVANAAVTSSVARLSFDSTGSLSTAQSIQVAVDTEQRCVRLRISGQSFADEGGC